MSETGLDVSREHSALECTSDEESDNGFELQDEDLRELYEEGKHKEGVTQDRDLTSSTRARQDLTKKRWEQYCISPSASR